MTAYWLGAWEGEGEEKKDWGQGITKREQLYLYVYVCVCVLGVSESHQICLGSEMWGSRSIGCWDPRRPGDAGGY